MPGSPLLRSKYTRPRLREHPVPRPRLTGLLDAALRAPLALVSAPAGFGKTSLLAEWAAGLPCSTAWLTLDAGDSDPNRFLTYLLEALRAALSEPGFGAPLEVLLHTLPPLPGEALLAALLEALQSSPGPLVVVLDDYHAIDSAAVHELMRGLVEHLPASLHLIIATRADPPLPLARLRARGQLVEVRADDLRFDLAETTRFLSGTAGLDLGQMDEPDALLALLVERTEGWAAGLQMAALAVGAAQGSAPTGGARDPLAILRGFHGSHRYVLDYLTEEVLARLPDATVDFLLLASVLDRFCADLCAFVTGGEETGAEEGSDPATRAASPAACQALLESLDKANLFLVPLDAERGWYRFHQLFADLLRARLKSSQPGRVPALHERAAEWFERAGLLAEAITHRLAAAAALGPNASRQEQYTIAARGPNTAGLSQYEIAARGPYTPRQEQYTIAARGPCTPRQEQYTIAARLIESAAMPLFLRGDTGTFFGWLAALPADLVEARPLLCVFRAAIFMLQGDTQQYARAMRPIEALLQQESQAGGASPQVRGVLNHLTGVRVAQADLSGSPLETIRLAEEALQSIGADPVNQVTVRLSLGHARYLLGDLAAARETWASAEAWIDPRQNPYAISLVLGHQARTSRVQGDLNAAAALYERALAGLAGNPDAVYMGLGLIEAGKADLLRERGDLAGARALAEQAMQHLPRLGGPNGLVFIHLALARVQVSQADPAGGLATLERVLPYCAHGSVYPEHREALEALRAAAWLGCGEKSRALQWAGQVESTPNPGFHDELARIAAARVRLETGSPAEALAALERLAEQSASAGRLGRLVEIEALRAAASHLQDKEDDAQAALGRALAIAAPQGWARIILEASGAIPGLLARGIRRADWPPEIIDYAKHLARLAQPSHPEETATGGLVEPLSPRELEVLRLIAQGLSNKEIAARLVLSTGTVRVHTASIYRKLDVESRTQAVARARVLRLIA